jgi:hypothetical protein
MLPSQFQTTTRNAEIHVSSEIESGFCESWMYYNSATSLSEICSLPYLL